MNLTQQEKLNRRLSFWDRVQARLHEVIDELQHVRAMQWADREDIDGAEDIADMLQDVEFAALTRVYEVFGTHVSDLRDKLEAKHSRKDAAQ